METISLDATHSLRNLLVSRLELVGTETSQHLQAFGEVLFMRMQGVDIVSGDLCVVFDLFDEPLASVFPFMAMVEKLDGLLQTDGDEQADDDSGDVDEEVLPGVRGFVRRMNIEHGWAPGQVLPAVELLFRCSQRGPGWDWIVHR